MEDKNQNKEVIIVLSLIVLILIAIIFFMTIGKKLDLNTKGIFDKNPDYKNKSLDFYHGNRDIIVDTFDCILEEDSMMDKKCIKVYDVKNKIFLKYKLADTGTITDYGPRIGITVFDKEEKDSSYVQYIKVRNADGEGLYSSYDYTKSGCNNVRVGSSLTGILLKVGDNICSGSYKIFGLNNPTVFEFIRVEKKSIFGSRYKYYKLGDIPMSGMVIKLNNNDTLGISTHSDMELLYMG